MSTEIDWWAETEEVAVTPNQQELPPGRYVAEIEEIKAGAWQNGDPRVEWTFRIADGEHKGRVTWMNDGLDTVARRGETKGHLTSVGVTGKTWSDVQANMKNANGARVNISRSVSKKNGKTYTNFYGPVSSAAAAPAPAVPPKQPDLQGTPPAASLYD